MVSEGEDHDDDGKVNQGMASRRKEGKTTDEEEEGSGGGECCF